MLTKRVVTATEARANLFDLLNKAERGEEVIIVKKDSNKRFKLIKEKNNPKANKALIVKQMGGIDFPFMSPQEIKKVILTKYDESLSRY